MDNPQQIDTRPVPHAPVAVVAQQFDPSITRGHPQLDRFVLDRLIPNRPALVLESNGHVAYVNSAALVLAGVGRDTPDPPRSRFVRDGNGELTGRLEEEGPSARSLWVFRW